MGRRRTPPGSTRKRWTTQEWLRFLRRIPADAPAARLAELDSEFGFSRSATRRSPSSGSDGDPFSYEPADAPLEKVPDEMGRRKFVQPLFEDWSKTPTGKPRAVAIYARPGRATIPSCGRGRKGLEGVFLMEAAALRSRRRRASAAGLPRCLQSGGPTGGRPCRGGRGPRGSTRSGRVHRS